MGSGIGGNIDLLLELTAAFCVGDVDVDLEPTGGGRMTRKKESPYDFAD